VYFLGISKGVDKPAAKLLSKDEARRIAANIAKLPELIRHRVLRKDSAFEASSADAVRGLILRIAVAKASEPVRGGHALFKAYETAIRATASRSTIAVNCTPRIVLCLGACSNADDTDANSQHEQREPHSRLLEWPPSYKCLFFVFLFHAHQRDEARAGLSASVAKLTELVRAAQGALG
jgi:NADH:ubiquinone oxidoreductase subunit E